MSLRVSPKFQVVIPQTVRSSLGLQAGTYVDVIVKGRVAYIVPIPSIKELQRRLATRLDQRALRHKKDRRL